MVLSKNKFFTLSFLFFTLFSLFTTKSVSAFSGTGSGTTESPYQITTCAQFQEIATSLDASYILQNDIDCSSVPNWTPIGADPGSSFTGILDGNNKKISNVSITDFSGFGAGIFGSVDDAEIKNLFIDNININTPSLTNVGGLAGGVGYNSIIGTIINNVHISGSVTGSSIVGGLLGATSNVTVTNSSSSTDVNSQGNVGGLIGMLFTSSTTSNIDNCFTSGDINGGTGDNTGGLIGYVLNSLTLISDSYSTGNITGTDYTGGLIGNFSGDAINNSYTTGNITGNSYIGGLVGIFNGNTATYLYTTGSVTSISGDYVGGLAGYMQGSETSDCHTFSQVESGGQYVGGLFGLFNNNSLATITNAYTKGSVTSTYNGTDNFSYVGGLIGHFTAGSGSSIDYSYALGNVSSIKGYVGGLIGNDSSLAGNVTISFVYATGNVTSTSGDKVGGLIGWNNSNINNVFASGSVSGVNTVGGLIGGDGSLEINKVYSSGSVSGSTLLGGLIGFIGSSTVLDSFYDSETSLQSDNVGKGIPKTTAEMKTVSTFTNWSFGSGTYVDWKLDSFGNMNNGYPFLMLSIQSIISDRNQTVSVSQPVNINSLNDPSFIIWLAPASPDVLTEGPTITKAPGDSITILAPSIPGTYYFYVSDSTDTSFYSDLDLISITVIDSQTTPTPTETPVVNGSNNNNQPSNNIDNHSCTSSKPLSIANLFQINTGKTSAKVFFSPLADTNQYFISFSEKPNAEEHGAQMTLAKEGVQNITIDKLKPNTTYYVKVRGQNGCMPGDWSNAMKFTTNSSNRIFYKNLTSKIGSFVKNIISKPITPKETNIETPNDLKVTPTIVSQKTNSYQSTPKTEVTETKQKKCFLWWCW